MVSDLSYVLYADDVGRVGACSNRPNAFLRLRAWDTSLDQHTHLIGVWQNLGKRQLMFVFRGRGAQDAYIFVKKLYAQQRLQGSIGEDAKHLGAWHHAKHSMVKEVQQRISAAKRAWSTFRGCWYDSAVSLRVRRLIFLAVVRTTLTSGLIAACLTETQHKQLEAQ
eukprot:14416490-Heterocapsa_arctica.AAC.1